MTITTDFTKTGQFKHEGPAPHLAGGRLVIDLFALAHNYRALVERASPARVAGVVKADGYGLGIEPVAQTLWNAGCRTFFVALPDEGIQLRNVLPDAEIYVFNGLFGADAAAAYRQARLLPVINSASDLSIWGAFGWDSEVSRPCALHVETGINRLGLTYDECIHFIQENALTQALTPGLVISHLACGDEPGNAMNKRQRESFQRFRAAFASIDSSLANSAGIFLGADYHCELVRPGIALYGAEPITGLGPEIRPVVTALSRVAQVKRVPQGESVGYGATPVSRDTIIAVCSTGYADGYLRSASSRADRAPVMGYLHGSNVPVIGRVSMDLTLFDVTDLGENRVVIGDHIELFGANMPIADVAAGCETIPYELMTSLGARYYREYVGAMK